MEALALACSWAAAAAMSAGAAELLARGGLTAANYRGRTVPQGGGFVLPLAYMIGSGILSTTRPGAASPRAGWATGVRWPLGV